MDYPGISYDGLLDGYRLVVFQDLDAEDPTTWGDHVQEGDDIHSKWAAGDVYIVTVQRRKTYASTDDASDTITLWEEVDSLGGCYLGDGYTAMVVAREHGFPGVAVDEHLDLLN